MGTAKLEGKVAIITGGGQGIGRALSLAFAREGASLVVCGRTVSFLEEVCEEAVRTGGASALAVRADVGVQSDVARMVKKAVKAFGKVDVLVNNAGVPGPTGLVTGIGKEAWDAVLRVNLTGMFLCSKAVVCHMMERGSGAVVNVSSGAGIRGSARVRSLPYVVSKFGVEGFTLALATQMKPYGVSVNAMRPGPLDTAFHKDTPPEFRTDQWKAMPRPEATGVGRLAVFLACQTVDTMTGESIDLKEWEKDPQGT